MKSTPTISHGLALLLAALGLAQPIAQAVSAANTANGIEHLTWSGNVDGVWDIMTTNWVGGGSPSTFSPGSHVTFNDNAFNYVIVHGEVSPASMTVNNSVSNYTFNSSGNGIRGPTGLSKSGTGYLALNGTNSYTGPTTVSNGTLVVNGTLMSGDIHVYGGVLSGSGSINGSVTVGSGGTLSPGTNCLINNTLNLSAGSTTMMRVGTGYTMIRGCSTLTYGGTLMITNAGASLAAGSSFKLFDASHYSGAFDSTNLPALGAGLLWYLSDLPINGTIRVVPSRSVSAAFNNNMVLQRGMPVPVWGSANPDQMVTVTFGGQSKTTTAGLNRKWLVRLDAMMANTNSQSLTIMIAGTADIVYTNVVVGDVWLASGQSNMDGVYTPVSYVTNAAAEIATANYPLIRAMKVKEIGSITPVWDVSLQRSWTVCSPSTVSNWSGTAYFFARNLFQNTGVPIGILETAYGGTLAEVWTSIDALDAVPELKTLADENLSQYYNNLLPINSTAGGLFNSMISPLIPFAVRGAIWYQGEFNFRNGQQYRVLLPTLIQDWRNRWQQTDFPFYIVQLPGFNCNPTYAAVREAQLLTLETTTNTGLAITIDVGESGNIHPHNKQDVGARLANLALNRNYGFTNIVPSGPIFRSAMIENSQIRIFFDYADDGLMTGQKTDLAPVQELVGVAPSWFEIAGVNQTYFKATARIDPDNTVVVSSPSVPDPTLVRYAWSAVPQGTNLYNRAGLPASPFRTAAWTNPPSTSSIQLNNGRVQLDCAVPLNVTWWVEFTDDLSGKCWSPLGVPQTGTGSSQSVSEPMHDRLQRFYRWRQAP